MKKLLKNATNCFKNLSSNVARFVIRLLVWLINIERRLPTLISQPYKLIWHYAFESNKFIFSLKNKPADYLMFGSGLRQLLFSRNYLCSLVRQLQTIMNRLFVLEVERAWARARRPWPNFWLSVNTPQHRGLMNFINEKSQIRLETGI